MKRAERFAALMNSVLSVLSSARQPQLASVGTSVLVHAAVVGLLLLVSGPVWTAAPRRTVTRLVLPARIAPRVAVLPKLPRPQVSKSQLHPLPSPVAIPLPPAKLLSLPVQTATQPALRIELATEMATGMAPVPMPALPVLSMPALPVRPAVPTKRTAAGMVGFDASPAEPGTGHRLVRAGSGFDDPTSVRATPGRRPVSSGSFDQTEVPADRPAVAKVVSTPFEGIEILEKPRPVYTDEARRLRIEGTVQLRVVFGAAGQIRVVSVVKGLGHGLDEAAVQAAQAIRFRPARRDGRPVDAPAVIQIQFQIA